MALLWPPARFLIETVKCCLLLLVSSRQVRSLLASLELPSSHLVFYSVNMK